MEQLAGAEVIAAHHVGGGAGGADVLRAGQPLLDETEEVGAGLPRRRPVGHGDVAQGVDDDEGGDGEPSEGGADPPVDPGEQREDTDRQQPVADDLDDEAGEEVAELVDIAVDALDEGAGGVGIVEGGVESQNVEGEVGAQVVGGGPADILGHPRLDEGDSLRQQRNAEKTTGDAEEHAQVIAGPRAVDKAAQQLRGQQLKRDPGHQQDTEQDRPPPLRPEIGGQQPPVITRRDTQPGRTFRGDRNLLEQSEYNSAVMYAEPWAYGVNALRPSHTFRDEPPSGREQ